MRMPSRYYTCVNVTGAPIHDGSNVATDEMCMATAYTFPSTTPTYCVDGNVH